MMVQPTLIDYNDVQFAIEEFQEKWTVEADKTERDNFENIYWYDAIAGHFTSERIEL